MEFIDFILIIHVVYYIVKRRGKNQEKDKGQTSGLENKMSLSHISVPAFSFWIES